MNIFLVDKNIPILAKTLQVGGNKVYGFTGSELTNKDIIDSGAEFLIVRSTTKVNEQLLKNTKIKFVATATSGIDHIDLEYLDANEIGFFAAFGSNSNSVAEYVIYSILFWMQREKISSKKLKVGIIGYGNIGKKVEIYLDSMGIESFINDPPLAKANLHSNKRYFDLSEILEICNVFTVHVPLITKPPYRTLNLLDADFIKKIKPNSLLINAARGGVVDELALLSRLPSLSFVIDTWQDEPDYNTSISNAAMIATPHIAGHSYNAKLNATVMIIKELNLEYKLNLTLGFVMAEYDNSIFLSKDYMKQHDIVFSTLEKYRDFGYDRSLMSSMNFDTNDVKTSIFKSIRDRYPKRQEVLFLK